MYKYLLISFGFLFLLQACSKQNVAEEPTLESYYPYRATKDSLWRHHSLKKAVSYVDSLNHSNVLNSDLGQYVYYIALSNLYYYEGRNHPKHSTFIDSAIFFIEPYRFRYPTEYAKALRMQGNIYITLQAYDKGMDAYLKSKAFIDNTFDPCYDLEFNTDIGNLLFSQGRYDDAILFYRETLKIRSNCETDNLKLYDHNLGTYNNIALAYEKLNRLDSALANYYNALIPQSIIDQKGEMEKAFSMGNNGIVHGNMGYVYFKLGNYAKADSLMNLNISNNKKPGQFYFDGLLTEIKLVELYIAQQRFLEANELLTSLYKESNIQRKDTFFSRLNRVKWLYYDAIESDKSNSYIYLLKFKRFDDSVKIANKSWEKFDINNNIQLKQNIASLSLLKEREKENYILLISILIVTLLLTFILIQKVKQSRFRKNALQSLEEFNEKLNFSYNELALSHSQKLELVRIVAHDLRNPISNITGFANLIETTRDIESIYSYSSIIYKVGHQALELINDLIKDDEFRLELHTKEHSIDDIVKRSVFLCQFQAKNKQLSIKTHLQPFIAHIDEDKLVRVLVNLISNAIKFNRQKGEIMLKTWIEGSYGMISIADNGVGIPEKLLPIIFDSNTKKMRTGTNNEESNGLGLVICKSIVEEHGGTIWVESEEGKGSTFFVRLPFLSSEDKG